MTTTAFFIEILVIGVQTTTWIALFLGAAAVGSPVSVNLTLLKEFSFLIVIFLLPWIYTTGIVADRLADIVFEAFINKRYLRRKQLSQHEFHFRAYAVLCAGSDAQINTMTY